MWSGQVWSGRAPFVVDRRDIDFDRPRRAVVGPPGRTYRSDRMTQVAASAARRSCSIDWRRDVRIPNFFGPPAVHESIIRSAADRRWLVPGA